MNSTIYLQTPSFTRERTRAAFHAQAIFDNGLGMWPPRDTARVQLDARTRRSSFERIAFRHALDQTLAALETL